MNKLERVWFEQVPIIIAIYVCVDPFNQSVSTLIHISCVYFSFYIGYLVAWIRHKGFWALFK